MKVESIAAALAVSSALLLGACGGGASASAEHAEHEEAAAAPAQPAAQPAAATAAADNVVIVKMVDDGATFHFEPKNVEVHPGDVVRFVHEGTQPHNVQFLKDGAPAGVDLGDAWSGPYVISKGETYEVTIDERFKPGTYKFTCTPHAGMNMNGTLVVQG